MRSKPHAWTLATVIRAGDDTTLVTLDGWYRGQILAPVATQLLQTLTGSPRQHLPGTRLWVKARLTALQPEELALEQWKPCDQLHADQAA
jgi:hypothetical protein